MWEEVEGEGGGRKRNKRGEGRRRDIKGRVEDEEMEGRGMQGEKNDE